MKLAFSKKTITIRSTGDQFGPYAFNLGPALPTGRIIATVAVKSYLVANNEISTPSTDALVESGATVSETTVTVRLQYPGAALVGHHVLLFEVTLDGDPVAKNGFLFGFILVESP